MSSAFQLREEERLRQGAGPQGRVDTDRERARQRALQRVHERQAGLRGRGIPLSKGSLREGNKPGPEQGQEARMQESDDQLSALLEQQTISEMKRNGWSDRDGQQEVETGGADTVGTGGAKRVLYLFRDCRSTHITCTRALRSSLCLCWVWG